MIPSIAIIGRVSIHARSCGRQPQYYTNPMRVAFRRHRELGHVRIRIGSQRAHVTFPKTGKLFDECNPAGNFFQSVARLADTHGLIGGLLPAGRRGFKFVEKFV